MKLRIVLWIFWAAIVAAYPAADEDANKIWPIPQLNGSIAWMTAEQAKREAETDNSSSRADENKLDRIRFFLYTQVNSLIGQEVDMNKPETLKRSNFNKNCPTYFMSHGWGGHRWDGSNSRIRDGLLLNGRYEEYNFFVVDWSVYAITPNYISAQTKCSKAGEIVAKFIDWLHDEAGLDFKTLTVIGHSLGAHVAGFTGKNVKRGRVNTIVGLDPAMPLFIYNKPNSRLSEDDGEYVETIQTNGQELGFYNPIGKASFYPNGGRRQPGCGIDVNGGCAHGRSVEYYAEAIARGERNAFVPVQCADFENLKNGNCSMKVGNVRLGYPGNRLNGASGVYYLTTHSKQPFGMGDL